MRGDTVGLIEKLAARWAVNSKVVFLKYLPKDSIAIDLFFPGDIIQDGRDALSITLIIATPASDWTKHRREKCRY